MSKPTQSWRIFVRSWRSLRNAIKKGVRLTTPRGFRLHVLGVPPFALSDVTPRTRGECLNAARPCPAILCTMHNWTQAPIDRPGRYRGGTSQSVLVDCRRPDADSCALDVADRGEHSAAAVAVIAGCHMRRIEQLVSLAAGKVQLEASRDNELAEDLGADEEPYTFRPSDEDTRSLRVPTKPIDASVSLCVVIGGRKVELTCTPEVSRTLLANLRHSQVTALRGLSREIRDRLASPDEAT